MIDVLGAEKAVIISHDWAHLLRGSGRPRSRCGFTLDQGLPRRPARPLAMPDSPQSHVR
jgi:hypothetical protein